MHWVLLGLVIRVNLFGGRSSLLELPTAKYAAHACLPYLSSSSLTNVTGAGMVVLFLMLLDCYYLNTVLGQPHATGKEQGLSLPAPACYAIEVHWDGVLPRQGWVLLQRHHLCALAAKGLRSTPGASVESEPRVWGVCLFGQCWRTAACRQSLSTLCRGVNASVESEV